MKLLPMLLMLLLGLYVGTPPSPAAGPPAKVNESVSGWSFRAIEAAQAEVKRHGLNIDDYQIFVFRFDSFLFVLFGSPADADFRKIVCAGPRPCLTVQLSVEDLRVIRSDYGIQNR